MISRRNFTFWISFGLFAVAERLKVYGLDELAAAMMRDDAGTATAKTLPTHWRVADNGVWRWYERETFVDNQWKLSGITTPIRMETGELAPARDGYLAEKLVPAEVRRTLPTAKASAPPAIEAASGKPSGVTVASHEEPASIDSDVIDVEEFAKHEPDPERRARHGRPPSKWLRSLHADELRIWLKTVECPEADVSGMTFWEHLTRDHSFAPAHLEGLTLEEQAKLHGAAHYGY